MSNEQTIKFYNEMFKEAVVDVVTAREINKNLRNIKNKYINSNELEYYLKRRILFLLQQANEKWCKAHIPSLFHNLGHVYDFCVDHFPNQADTVLRAITNVTIAAITIKYAKHEIITSLDLAKLFSMKRNKKVVDELQILSTAFDVFYNDIIPTKQREFLKNESLNMLITLNRITDNSYNFTKTVNIQYINSKKNYTTDELNYALYSIKRLHDYEFAENKIDKDLNYFFFYDLFHLYSHLFLNSFLSRYEQASRYPEPKKRAKELRLFLADANFNWVKKFTFNSILKSYSNISSKEEADDIDKLNKFIKILHHNKELQNLQKIEFKKYEKVVKSLLELNGKPERHLQDIIKKF